MQSESCARFAKCQLWRNIDRTAFFSAMDKMAEDAIASGSPANTMKPVTKADVIRIYRSLWET